MSREEPAPSDSNVEDPEWKRLVPLPDESSLSYIRRVEWAKWKDSVGLDGKVIRTKEDLVRDLWEHGIPWKVESFGPLPDCPPYRKWIEVNETRYSKKKKKKKKKKIYHRNKNFF
jgi:hypothetical protein